MTNLLIAFRNLVQNPVVDIASRYKSSNRANSMGDAFEFYIKDLFCGLFSNDLRNRDKEYSEYFSYLGNQNNPPDIIIRGGDAIEIKKVENLNSGLALNSSYPKDKLHSDSPMITKACRDCEDWNEKDVMYTVGVIQNLELKSLWFVYGNCYAADKETYERIKQKISMGINGLEGVGFSDTNELGRVNKVDPLGITYLRIRGMWHIESPAKVFGNLVGGTDNKKFTANALMLKEKYLSFSENDRKSLESLKKNGVMISDVGIKSPNNPATILNAKLISFSI